ncbi:MAG: hypothetical protein WC277_06655 [Bacilli bacterium]
MAYCTTSELVAKTGTTIATATLEEIVADADRRVDSFLAHHGLSGSTDDHCKTASLHFSIAGVYTRMQMDGTLPESITAAEVDRAISRHEATARTALEQYVEANRRTYRRSRLRRVNG